MAVGTKTGSGKGDTVMILNPFRDKDLGSFTLDEYDETTIEAIARFLRKMELFGLEERVIGILCEKDEDGLESGCATVIKRRIVRAIKRMQAIKKDEAEGRESEDSRESVKSELRDHIESIIEIHKKESVRN